MNNLQESTNNSERYGVHTGLTPLV